jgi:hypothetical protein
MKNGEIYSTWRSRMDAATSSSCSNYGALSGRFKQGAKICKASTDQPLLQPPPFFSNIGATQTLHCHMSCAALTNDPCAHPYICIERRLGRVDCPIKEEFGHHNCGYQETVTEEEEHEINLTRQIPLKRIKWLGDNITMLVSETRYRKVGISSTTARFMTVTVKEREEEDPNEITGYEGSDQYDSELDSELTRPPISSDSESTDSSAEESHIETRAPSAGLALPPSRAAIPLTPNPATPKPTIEWKAPESPAPTVPKVSPMSPEPRTPRRKPARKGWGKKKKPMEDSTDSSDDEVAQTK